MAWECTEYLSALNAHGRMHALCEPQRRMQACVHACMHACMPARMPAACMPTYAPHMYAVCDMTIIPVCDIECLVARCEGEPGGVVEGGVVGGPVQIVWHASTAGDRRDHQRVRLHVAYGVVPAVSDVEVASVRREREPLRAIEARTGARAVDRSGGSECALASQRRDERRHVQEADRRHPGRMAGRWRGGRGRRGWRRQWGRQRWR